MSNELYKNSKHFENRGSIYTIYKSEDFGIDFKQDKISKSYQGVIRGFHADKHISKLITCLHGKVRFITYDFKTDKKQDYTLDGDSKTSESVLIPADTLNAHQCLSAVCIFHYKWSDYYQGTKDQRVVYFNDADIDPQWSEEFNFIVAERDENAPSLKELKKNDR
tara:strand:- start:2838 stop:3332 length:495 start_codon:yes stop_codon:yes gene_type:complete